MRYIMTVVMLASSGLGAMQSSGENNSVLQKKFTLDKNQVEQRLQLKERMLNPLDEGIGNITSVYGFIEKHGKLSDRLSGTKTGNQVLLAIIYANIEAKRELTLKRVFPLGGDTCDKLLNQVDQAQDSILYDLFDKETARQLHDARK